MNDPLVNMHEMVQRFNEDLVGIDIPSEPRILRADRTNFRLTHLEEELVETADAFRADDFHGAVDGLLDLTYVALGALVEMGICVNGAFEEVHAANMRKVRGVAGSNPKRPTDTVTKPKGWVPADLTPYLTLSKADFLLADEVGRQKSFAVEALATQPSETVNIKPKRMVGSDRNPKKKKILVMGYARHGKDTAADMIAQRYGLSFTSSSMFCAEHVMMPHFEKHLMKYDSVEACYEDRINWRDTWYTTIRDYNRPDATALGRAIFEKHDIYCGLRSRAEFDALKNTGAFDISVWVDAQDRGLPPESNDSCTVRPWMVDYVVDNGGSEGDLHFNIKQLLDRVL